MAGARGATITEAVASYLEDMEPPQREPKTYVSYKYCLELFASHCAKRFIHDVKREDLLAFIRKLYELNCGPPHGLPPGGDCFAVAEGERNYKAAPQPRLAGICLYSHLHAMTAHTYRASANCKKRKDHEAGCDCAALFTAMRVLSRRSDSTFLGMLRINGVTSHAISHGTVRLKPIDSTSM